MGMVTWTGEVKIAQVSDLSTEVGFEAGTFNDNSAGRVRTETAVDGTKRSFTSSGVPRTFQLVARYCNRTDFETLQGWVASTLQLRGPAGRVVYGVLEDVNGQDRPGPSDIGVANVTLRVTEVTYTVAV